MILICGISCDFILIDIHLENVLETGQETALEIASEVVAGVAPAAGHIQGITRHHGADPGLCNDVARLVTYHTRRRGTDAQSICKSNESTCLFACNDCPSDEKPSQELYEAIADRVARIAAQDIKRVAEEQGV